LLALATGIVLLGLAVWPVVRGGPPAWGGGELGETVAAAPRPSSPATATTSPTPEPALAATQADAPFQPTTLVFPALHVTADVRTVGILENGDLEVPTDPSVVGWWTGSAEAAAARGQTVVAGHVYTRAGGQGAFFRLIGVSAGDRVLIAGKDGQRQTYTVKDVAVYPKDDLPLNRMFGQDTDHRLVLISCAGFDRRTGHYEENVVVYATPDVA
jgi:hypothetical protein